MIVQDLTLRVDWRSAVDAGGKLDPAPLEILGADDGLLRVTVRANDAAVYPLPAILRFGVRALRMNPKPGESPFTEKLIFSDADQVNVPGDWAGADLAQGKFAIRYTSDSTPLVNLFRECGQAEVAGICDVEAEDAGGRVWRLAQFGARLRANVIAGSADPVPTGAKYATLAQLNALREIAVMVTGDGGLSLGSAPESAIALNYLILRNPDTEREVRITVRGDFNQLEREELPE